MVAPGPEFSVQDVYHGWIAGLQAQGVRTTAFNLHDRLNFYADAQLERDGEMRKALSMEGAVKITLEGLLGVLYECEPELVVFTSGFFLDYDLVDLIRAKGRHKLVMLHTESPYEEDRQVDAAQHFDVNVLNDPINIDRYPKGTVYIPHAYNPAVHHARGRSVEWDFAFVGTGYPSRTDFFEKVEWGDAAVAIGGNWPNVTDDSPLARLLLHEPGECIDNTDTADLYRSAAMSANLYRGGDVSEAERPELTEGWAMGPREVELAACGTFFAREPRGEGDELFPMLPLITEPSELSDVLRWSRENPERREAAAEDARAAIVDRTFANNAAALLTAAGI